MSGAVQPDGRPGTSWGVRAAVTVMCLVWGSTWLVLKDGLAEMPPLGSAGLRFLIAWVVMVPLAPVIARAEGGGAPTWDLVVAMATGNFAISYGLVYWAEEILPSSLAAILWGVFPLLTALVGHVYLPASRIVGVQWLGTRPRFRRRGDALRHRRRGRGLRGAPARAACSSSARRCPRSPPRT